MLPTRTTCLTCGKSFADNGQLASIPDASTIAFDPGQRRVWRICPSCGEWNLLGPEASAAALPEVAARFAAARPAGSRELDFAPVRIGGELEILRIGTALATDDATPALQLRAEVDKRSKMNRRLYAFLAVLFLGWCAFSLWYTHGSLGFVPELLLIYSAITLLQFGMNRFRGKKESPLGAMIAVGALVLGVALSLATHQRETLWLTIAAVAITAPISLALIPLMTRHWGVRLPMTEGKALWLSQHQMRRITMTWTPGGTEISVHDLPRGRAVYGADIAKVLGVIFQFAHQRGFVQLMLSLNATTEKAYELLLAVGGLGGLLRALEGFRHDNDGRVTIMELPAVYIVALELALKQQTAGPVSLEAIRQKALEASAVAGVAEELQK